MPPRYRCNVTDHDPRCDPLDGPPPPVPMGSVRLVAVELRRVTGDWCPDCALPSGYRVLFVAVSHRSLVVMYRQLGVGCDECGRVVSMSLPVDGSGDKAAWRPDLLSTLPRG